MTSSVLYQNEQDTDSPLARWRFEETSGTTFAEDVGSVTATLTGSVTPGTVYPSGPYPAPGVGADFAGGYASMTGVLAWVPLSVEALVWLDTVPSTGSANRPMIFCHNYATTDMPLMLGWNIDGAHQGRLGVGFFSNAAAAFRSVHMTTAVATGTLLHIVGVRTGTTTLDLYVDDTNVATGTVTAFTSGTKNGTAYIGRRWDQPTQVIDGRVYDLALYNGSLDSTRVSAHYTASQQLAGLQVSTGGPTVDPDGAGSVTGSWTGTVRTGGRLSWTSPTVGEGAPARYRFTPHPSDYV